MISVRRGIFILFAAATVWGCGQRGGLEAGPGVGGTAAAVETRVADSLATHALVTAAPDAGPLTALGNEPFWNVRVTAEGIFYTDPEHADGYHFPPVQAVREADARVYRSVRDLPAGETGPRSLELRIREEPCSDGMSDRKYAYSAVLKLGELTLNGCARFDRPSP